MIGPVEVATYRAVVTCNVLRLIELAEDVLREHLAKLDTHLVWQNDISALRDTSEWPNALTEGVDAPDDTLREDLVLVERDESTEGRRREQREDDAVAWAVALEALGLDEGV